MKAILIVYNQALDAEVLELLDRLAIRGFTRWRDVQGRGSHTGNPHLGSHSWPALNGAMLCVVEEAQVEPLLEALEALDAEDRGLRTFVWSVEHSR